MKNWLSIPCLCMAFSAVAQTPEADNRRIMEGNRNAFSVNTTIVYKSEYKSTAGQAQSSSRTYSGGGNTNAQSAGNVGNALGKLGASIDRRKAEKANTIQRGILFNNWKSAKKFGNWNYLETKKDDANVYRYFDDGIWQVDHHTTNYTWATLWLDKIGRSSYVYEAVLEIDKEGYDKGEFGLLLNIDAIENASDHDKLIFLLRPEDQMYWIGNYSSADNNRWTTFNEGYIPEKGYWSISEKINKFNEQGKSKNVLKIKKLGNDIMFFVNGNILLHFYFTEKPYFYNISGLGIIQGKTFKGRVPSISFEAY